VPQKNDLWRLRASWEVFRKLAQQKRAGSRGHLLADHVHMLISIRRNIAVSQWLASSREECDPFGSVYGEKKRSFVGQHFWARGYFSPPSDGTKN